MLFCFAEKGAISKKSAEDLLEDIEDALFLQTAPVDQIFKFIDNNLAYSRLSNMSGVLNQTDNIASLYGRSCFVANHTHYTGLPTFFSDSISQTQLLDLEEVRRFGAEYVTPGPHGKMIITPMDKEDRERLEAGAAKADEDNQVSADHRAKDDRSRQLFDTASLTPDAIKAVTVVPDVEKMTEFTLDNGLQVVVMNHGEAPLVQIGLMVKGDDLVAPKPGMDSLAEALYRVSSSEFTDMTVDPLRVAGSAYRVEDAILASGGSGNVEHATTWTLPARQHRLGDGQQGTAGQRVARRRRQPRDRPRGVGRSPHTQRIPVPQQPYGTWMTPADYDVMAEFSKADLVDWQQTKWQPANAYLVVVGKVDPDETKRLVSDYPVLEVRRGGYPGRVAPAPRATEFVRPQGHAVRQPDWHAVQGDRGLPPQGRKARPTTPARW